VPKVSDLKEKLSDWEKEKTLNCKSVPKDEDPFNEW
jgi:hypothetical protein